MIFTIFLVVILILLYAVYTFYVVHFFGAVTSNRRVFKNAKEFIDGTKILKSITYCKFDRKKIFKVYKERNVLKLKLFDKTPESDYISKYLSMYNCIDNTMIIDEDTYYSLLDKLISYYEGKDHVIRTKWEIG